MLSMKLAPLEYRQSRFKIEVQPAFQLRVAFDKKYFPLSEYNLKVDFTRWPESMAGPRWEKDYGKT